MQTKFLKDAVGSIVGKQMEPLVDILSGDIYVNEFLIAKKLGIEINQTRNILYKLSDYGLVSSTRKKDSRKGWYTYFWKIEILKSLEFLSEIIEKRINNLNNQIKSRETKRFYYCETCNVEHSEDNALLNDFTCGECGNVFVLKDNVKNIRDYKKESDNLEKEIVLLKEEISKLREKEGKRKNRVIKKELKLVKEKRAKQRAVNKLAKLKLNNSVKEKDKKR